MIYGTTNVHAVRDVTDLIGIRTLILRQYWQAAATNPSQSELDGMKPGIPGVPGGLMLMGEQTMKERGRYQTLWTFQGINGDGKEVTFKTRGKSIDYGFEPGFSQVPIQQHKDYEAMQVKFQGYPGNDGTTVIWPPNLAATAGTGLSTKNQTAGAINPMYGFQAFFEMDGVYRYRYAAISLPGNLEEGVGFISTNLPGKPPALKDGRNWLKAPTAYELKGYVYDITEYYWLSRRGGWPEPIYRQGYFGGIGSGSSQGPASLSDVSLVQSGSNNFG